jgi:hypothetical protein
MRDVSPVGRPFFLSDAQLRQSLQADNSDVAMARVWRRLHAGEPLRIGVLGSSVAMSGGCQVEHQPQLRCAQFDGVQVRKRFARGYGVIDDEMRGLLHNADRPVRGFVLQMLDAINATWPHRDHRIVNAAVDAWTAKAIEPCLLSDEELISSDLLLLELGSQSWHPSQPAASERIVRKLLARAAGPPPAIVMVTTRQWCGRSVHGLRRKERPVLLKTWDGIEDVFSRFCTAYGMACLSLRDAIFADVVVGRANFTIPDVAADCLHPEQSRVGYHYMADMLVHFLRQSWRRYSERTSRAAALLGEAAAKEALIESARSSSASLLPQALLPGNRGSAGRMVWRCYHLSPTASTSLAERRQAGSIAKRTRSLPELQWQAEVSSNKTTFPAALSDTPSCDALRRCVLRTTRTSSSCLLGRGHWQHCSRALAQRPVMKPGIVSVLPGAVMRLVLDTRPPIATRTGDRSQPLQPALALTYLTSYEHMGVCVVSCESGCTCDARAIDALQFAQPAAATTASSIVAGDVLARNVSIASVVEVPVSSAHTCIVKLENTLRPSSHNPKPALELAKWKLLQVRVGWDTGGGDASSRVTHSHRLHKR